MFTFPIADVRAVIDRGRSDAATNNGFRQPHDGLAPAGQTKPGLWLVGDEGVYIMSNGRLAAGQRPLVIYAAECDPSTNPDWWHYKRCHFGGDDGVDFLDADAIERLFAASPAATHLVIEMTDNDMSLVAIHR